MAGTVKGGAPALVRNRRGGFPISFRLVIPRLPTPRAIFMPGLTLSRNPVCMNWLSRRLEKSSFCEVGKLCSISSILGKWLDMFITEKPLDRTQTTIYATGSSHSDCEGGSF